MLRIEIHNPNPNPRQITPRNGNAPFTIYEQDAWIHYPNQPYPTKFKFRVEGPQAGYAKGLYTLHPESLGVNQYGDLEINRFSFALVPVQKEQEKAS